MPFDSTKIILFLSRHSATGYGLILPSNLESARRSGETKEKPRVLIVEDDAMIAWDMSLSLEAAGFQVCGIVSNGAAALERSRESVALWSASREGFCRQKIRASRTGDA